MGQPCSDDEDDTADNKDMTSAAPNGSAAEASVVESSLASSQASNKGSGEVVFADWDSAVVGSESDIGIGRNSADPVVNQTFDDSATGIDVSMKMVAIEESDDDGDGGTCSSASPWWSKFGIDKEISSRSESELREVFSIDSLCNFLNLIWSYKIF